MLNKLYYETIDPVYGVQIDFINNTYTRIQEAVGKTAVAGFDDIPCWGGRRRCNLADNGTVNAYYGDAGYIEDGSNGQVMVEQPKFWYKVVPLITEPNNDVEITTLAVTAGASSNGDITITLGGIPFTIAVVSGDTTSVVAGKIRSTVFTGWTVLGSSTSAVFTKDVYGYVATATFSGGTTGVTATVTATQKGYTGKGYKLRKGDYYISSVRKAGFKLHPAFIKNGIEKDKIYLSAYEGCAYDVSGSVYFKADEQTVDFTVTTGDKLSSIASAKPISGLTQDLTRRKAGIIAENRGTGWSQSYCATVSATQMLYAIEYAHMNSQTQIALGVVNKASGTGNESEITGGTSSLGNATGMATGTNGLVSVTYRGEENFWGNIWKFTDGMNILCDVANSVHDLYVSDNGFTESKNTSPYVNAGINLPTRDGYISAFAYNATYDWLFVPAEVLGSSSIPVGDYFYQAAITAGYKIARLGGAWYGGVVAGSFCWSVAAAPSHRYRAVSARLVYVP